MINERIEYINKLGKHKILEIMKQNNGLYFMAILYRGEVISFERNCTKQRVEEFRKKINKTKKASKSSPLFISTFQVSR